MFDRLARVINRVPWVVVGVAIVFAALSGVFGGSVSKSLQVGGFQDPSSQSSQALDRLEQATGMRADGGIVVLIKTPDGTNSDTAIAEVTKVSGVIGADPDIAKVFNWYVTHDPSMVAKDGSSTIVVGYWNKISDQEAVAGATRIADQLKSDPNVKLGGFAAINHQLNTIITGDLAHAELQEQAGPGPRAVSYTHLRAHETSLHLVCRLLLARVEPVSYTHLTLPTILLV